MRRLNARGPRADSRGGARFGFRRTRARGGTVDTVDAHIPSDDGVPAPYEEVAASDVERQFQRLVEHIPGIVAYMDLVQLDNPGSSIPLYISPQIEDLLGYPRDAWLTDDELWLDVLHPEDAERMIAADAEARRTLSQLFAEFRMIAKDELVVWVSEKAAVVEVDVAGTLYCRCSMS